MTTQEWPEPPGPKPSSPSLRVAAQPREPGEPVDYASGRQAGPGKVRPAEAAAFVVDWQLGPREFLRG